MSNPDPRPGFEAALRAAARAKFDHDLAERRMMNPHTGGVGYGGGGPEALVRPIIEAAYIEIAKALRT